MWTARRLGPTASTPRPSGWPRDPRVGCLGCQSDQQSAHLGSWGLETFLGQGELLEHAPWGACVAPAARGQKLLWPELGQSPQGPRERRPRDTKVPRH